MFCAPQNQQSMQRGMQLRTITLKLAGKRKLVLSDRTRAKLKTIGPEMLYSRDWFETDRYCGICDYSRAEHQLADVLPR